MDVFIFSFLELSIWFLSAFFFFFVHPTSIFLEQLLKYYYKRITKSIFPVMVPAQFMYRAWLIACVYLQSLHLCYGNSFYSGFQQSLYANMELVCQIWPFLRFQMVQNGMSSWRNMMEGGGGLVWKWLVQICKLSWSNHGALASVQIWRKFTIWCTHIWCHCNRNRLSFRWPTPRS